MAHQNTAARSTLSDRRRLPPPPPVSIPSPMRVPYYDPYASALPMGNMPPPPPPPGPSSSFVPPPLPIPYWDDHTYIHTQTPPLPPPGPSSSFVPAPLAIPYWDDHTYIHTQTPPPLSRFHPPPTPLPYWNNTQTLHPPWFPPPLSPQELRNKILKQIEYYFSDENLFRDNYLKKKMDEEGWVPVTVIAGFPRISALTNDIPLILFTMRQHSKTVEVEGQKLRRRTCWKQWLTFRDLFESKSYKMPAWLHGINVNATHSEVSTKHGTST